MNPQAIELKDFHFPQHSIDGWPPAIGWWILAILIPLLCYFIYRGYKWLTRKTVVKTAKKLLFSLKQDAQLADADKLKQLSSLIRRVAISLSSREQTASLTGQKWLEYLDSSVSGSPFTQGVGKVFATNQYHKNPTHNLDINSIIALCEDWIKAQPRNKQ